MAVMGSGDIGVGKTPSTHQSTTAPPDKRAKAPPGAVATVAKAEAHCGAMSQQRGDSGAISTPQKFVRLVGCREVKARPFVED
jgi:hypothetical protein